MKCRALNSKNQVIWFGRDFSKKATKSSITLNTGETVILDHIVNTNEIVNINGKLYIVSKSSVYELKGNACVDLATQFNNYSGSARIADIQYLDDGNVRLSCVLDQVSTDYGTQQSVNMNGLYENSIVDKLLIEKFDEWDSDDKSLILKTNLSPQYNNVEIWYGLDNDDKDMNDYDVYPARYEDDAEQEIGYYIVVPKSKIVEPDMTRQLYIFGLADIIKALDVKTVAEGGTIENTTFTRKNLTFISTNFAKEDGWLRDFRITDTREYVPLFINRGKVEIAESFDADTSITTRSCPVFPALDFLLDNGSYEYWSPNDRAFYSEIVPGVRERIFAAPYYSSDGTVTFVSDKVENYTENSQAVADSLTQRLSVIKGELWYQVNYGLPLMEKQRGTNVLDLVIGDIISSHPGVASLDSYISKVVGHEYSYECKITTVFADSLTISNKLTI